MMDSRCTMKVGLSISNVSQCGISHLSVKPNSVLGVNYLKWTLR